MDEVQAGAIAFGDERVEPLARRWLIFLLAVACLPADFLVLDFAHYLRVLANLPTVSQWNWLGKIMSIAFSCLLLVCSPWLRQNVGLRWRQSPGSARWSVGSFVAYLVANWHRLSVPPLEFSADTLMFQFIMPGIDEELMDRGIMLALFERAFGKNPMSCRLHFGLRCADYHVDLRPWHRTLRCGRTLSVFSFALFHHRGMGRIGRPCSHSIGKPAVAGSLSRAWDGSIFLVAMVR